MEPITEANLRVVFATRFNKTVKDHICAEIAKSPALTRALIELVIHPGKPFKMGPSWVLSYAGVAQPEVFYERLPDILASLDAHTHSSVYRCIARIFMRTDIPVSSAGLAIQCIVQWLLDPAQSAAVKAFCIHASARLIKNYPELAPEIRGIVEDLLPYATPGMQNAAEKLFSLLAKKGL